MQSKPVEIRTMNNYIRKNWPLILWLTFVASMMLCGLALMVSAARAELTYTPDGVRVEGICELPAPIVFPTNRSYRVYRATSDARLDYVGPADQPAIQIAPTAPADGLYVDMEQLLDGVHLHGGRVSIIGGGKYVKTSGLRITGNKTGDYALAVVDCDGPTIQAYVHENLIGGISFVNCHSVVMDVTSRCNQFEGWYAKWCGALTGRLYTEANGRLNQRWVNCSRSTLSAWMEYSFWPATPNPIYAGWQVIPPQSYQGQRRNCFAMNFSGMIQEDSNQAWDDDPVSHLFNPAPRDLSEQRFAPYRLASTLTPVLRNWEGRIDLDAQGNLLIHKGAFDNLGGAARSLEFVDKSGGMAKVPIKAGDSLVVAYSVGSPQWQYLAAANLPTVRIKSLADHLPNFGQNYYVTRPGISSSYNWPEQYTKDAVGPRVFVDMGIGAAGGPSQDVTLSLSASAFLIPGSWK